MRRVIGQKRFWNLYERMIRRLKRDEILTRQGHINAGRLMAQHHPYLTRQYAPWLFLKK